MTPPEDATAVLDEEKKKELCALVSLGLLRQVAARYVGSTDLEVCRAADEDADFRASLYRAQRNCEIRYLQHIQDAGKKYWQASAWALERMYPDRYARRGPDVVTSLELDYTLARLADLVLAHVPEPDRRDKIQAELGQLVDELALRRGSAPA